MLATSLWYDFLKTLSLLNSGETKNDKKKKEKKKSGLSGKNVGAGYKNIKSMS